jgi:NitT/TauT family transport system ATP-binding protein
VIHVNALCKHFDNGNLEVLNNISFHVDGGDSVAIIGPSGCGKTTLLYILSGLIRHFSGTVIINEKEIKCPSRKRAFILQDFGLLPWKTVWQNVCLGMKINGFPKKEQDATAEKLLHNLGLLQHKDYYPARLSGGEKQRVAIARALALKPEILLMDEPFSSLDTFAREKLQDILIKIWQANQLTIIIVTHNIEEAVFLGKKIIVLSGRPASIKTIIENPDAEKLSYRTADSFFATCKMVRKMVEAI